MGVPYDLFWKLNPKKLEPFTKAHKLKVEVRHERDNLLAWLIGYYHTEALGAGFAKNHKYPDKPIELRKEEKSDFEKFAEYAKVHAENLRKLRAQRRANGNNAG